MLVFFDESGDSGIRGKDGSSKFFVTALCLFEDEEVATECDRRIFRLRGELHLPEDYEFHFSVNPDRVRRAFLEAVAPYEFLYFAFILT